MDAKSDLLPSLGQDMAEYNILTNSIKNQSQIDNQGTPTKISVPSERESHMSVGQQSLTERIRAS